MPLPSLDERLLYALSNMDIVVDTGTLLVHAAGRFENGKYLPLVCGFLKEKNLTEVSRRLFTLIDRLLVTVPSVIVTPHVLTEFFALLDSRLKGVGELDNLKRMYTEVLLNLSEEPVPKDKLLSSEEFRKFGVSDAAVVQAAGSRDAIIITVDNPLRQWCRAQGLPAQHVYYDIYLNS